MNHRVAPGILLEKWQSLPLHILLLGLGTLILAIHPMIWLAQTWLDPAYDSMGILIFAGFVSLLTWSVSSPRISHSKAKKPFAVGMLVATSILRLLSQVLAINILGAMALVVDVYALGLLLGLPHRQRPLSPGWLAIVFAFSLPLTNLLQRTAGYLLQWVSAQGAGAVLAAFFPETTMEGVRIFLAGKEILVDLPCSGAQCTTVLLLLYAFLMTLQRPGLMAALLGTGWVILTAFVVNTVRIVLMALAIAFPAVVGGLDILAQPWHDLVGLVTLLLFGFMPLLFWSRSVLPRLVNGPGIRIQCPLLVARVMNQRAMCLPRHCRLVLASLFLGLALLIIRLPQAPLDISQALTPVYLPVSINNAAGRPVALTAKEQAYFTRYGGRATKMQYGRQALMVVQTTAPLRHLHNPADCLRGLGFQVRYLGVEDRLLPSAVYRATSLDGQSWRVAVTFVTRDASGRPWATPSVAEAIWHWFGEPSGQWMAVQRISPAEATLEEQLAWEQSVAVALDLPIMPASNSLIARPQAQNSVHSVNQSEGVQ
jgi:exosortase/archaeosortase family protein